MPVMDGINATKKIREYISNANIKKDEAPIIIGVTGHVLDHFKEAGLNAGMDEILSKPLQAKVLKEKLKKYKII